MDKDKLLQEATALMASMALKEHRSSGRRARKRVHRQGARREAQPSQARATRCLIQFDASSRTSPAKIASSVRMTGCTSSDACTTSTTRRRSFCLVGTCGSFLGPQGGEQITAES